MYISRVDNTSKRIAYKPKIIIWFVLHLVEGKQTKKKIQEEKDLINEIASFLILIDYLEDAQCMPSLSLTHVHTHIHLS